MCISHSDTKMPTSFQDGLFLKFLEILCIVLLCRVLNASAEMPGNLSRGERRGNSLNPIRKIRLSNLPLMQLYSSDQNVPMSSAEVLCRLQLLSSDTPSSKATKISVAKMFTPLEIGAACK